MLDHAVLEAPESEVLNLKNHALGGPVASVVAAVEKLEVNVSKKQLQIKQTVREAGASEQRLSQDNNALITKNERLEAEIAAIRAENKTLKHQIEEVTAKLDQTIEYLSVMAG